VPLGDKQVLDLIKGSKIKSCTIDPLPASLMRECYTTLVPVFKRIINQSFATGQMPDELKTAMLLPLLKKANADSENLANYRPVSSLKFVSKLIEKAILNQLNDYLTDNDLHVTLQSAYKVFHSTETSLLRVHNDIVLAFDKGENVLLILLDLSAAFDTVNHSLLLSRLQQRYGLCGTVLIKWFESYLCNRTQFVNINESYSSKHFLSVGVLQGFCFGACIISHVYISSQ